MLIIMVDIRFDQWLSLAYANTHGLLIHKYTLGLVYPFAMLRNAVIQQPNILRNESNMFVKRFVDFADEVAVECFSSKY